MRPWDREFLLGVLSLPFESEVDLAIDVLPLGCGSQLRHEFLERVSEFRGELEPGQKVEWLRQIPAVIELSRDGGKILQADLGVMGLILERSRAARPGRDPTMPAFS